MYIHLYVPDADALFNRAVAAGARIDFAMQDMFWGDRYGKLTDPFGQQWGIATHIEDVAPEEMKKRLVRKPELIIEDAVSRMLPKNKLGKQMFTKLKVYRGDKHPHDAQKPEAKVFA